MTDDDSEQDALSEGASEIHNSRLVARVKGAMERMSGKVYRVKLERLDRESLEALLRFLNDVESSHSTALRRVRMNPWAR